MAYCTAEEVFGQIKESAYNALLGDEYIEDPEERKRRLQPLWRKPWRTLTRK